MNVDIGNILTDKSQPSLDKHEFEELAERVRVGHERIAEGRENNEFGYAALNLPETVDSDEIRRKTDHFADSDAVLTVGIGGSALGAATITTAVGNDEVEHYVLDNVDPEHTQSVLNSLDLGKTAVHVVSRSGTTAETLATFLVVREAMDDAGVDWTEQTIVTTGDDGPLRTLAETHALPALDVPDNVPGRFSALSTVALVPAAIQDCDIDAFLDGGKEGAESLSPSLSDCPAYAYGAVSYALGQRGADMNVMMPYAERLEPFSEWFAQLWAESLGKDGGGQTPVRALGATDQHSQLQLYRAGPRNKLVTFVRPQETANVTIPETDIDELSYLGGSELGSLLDAEFEATEASLATAGCPNVRIEIEQLNEQSLGRLLYDMEAACILAGELYDVETFTQPAVEWGKRAARGLLGESEFEEAAAIAEKNRHIID
ncbi:glucose-6-phosphate isomerase [Halovenus rubra]|uniref:Glucose-6-phosphate isomerase n=2 Tax=Halovenus rubra TaxID=869890 RepID=A0ACC7DY91_9EURY|nr:glucose-6-phosphate isomerase [Halovenus rubra]